VFAFVSNEKLNDSVRGFNTTVNTALDNALDFIDDTQMVGQHGVFSQVNICLMQQANATIDRYDEINTFVQCQVNSKCCGFVCACRVAMIYSVRQ